MDFGGKCPTRIFPENPYDRLGEADKWRKDFKKKYGFAIPSMQSIWYGRSEKIFGSEEERSALIAYTKKAIVFAETIGCGNLVFGCPRNRSIPDNGDIEIALNFFKEIGDYAYEHHTVVAMGAMVENGETLDVLKGKSQLLNHVHISELGLESIQHREIHNHLADYQA